MVMCCMCVPKGMSFAVGTWSGEGEVACVRRVSADLAVSE